MRAQAIHDVLISHGFRSCANTDGWAAMYRLEIKPNEYVDVFLQKPGYGVRRTSGRAHGFRYLWVASVDTATELLATIGMAKRLEEA